MELRHYLLVERLLQRDQREVGSAISLDLPDQLHVARVFHNIIVERLSHKAQPAVFSVVDRALLLPIPGRIAVQGTPWIASAELVVDAVTQKVKDALLREDWSEVWRLLPSTRYTTYIDADSAGSLLQVRTRRPGDRIQPLGMAHEKKVQDVLVNKRIARADRPSIPLFFSSSHCIWLAGVQIDDRARLTNKTQRIVRLSIEPWLSS